MYEIYAKLRDEKGVKDATVARETGIGKSTFTDWKSGRSVPKDEKLQKIADYFGVSTDYLRTGKRKYVFKIDAKAVNKAIDKAIAEKYGEEYTFDGLQKQLEKMIDDEFSEQDIYYTDPETAKAAQEIFDDPDLHALFDAARDSKPDALKAAAALLKVYKEASND